MTNKQIIETLRKDAVELIKRIPESGKVHLYVEFFNCTYPELLVRVTLPIGENIEDWKTELYMLDLLKGKKVYNKKKAEVYDAIAKFDKMAMEA